MTFGQSGRLVVDLVSGFLTTKEVATLLRIKERTVYELVKEGSIPVSRVTGKLLFPRELVEAWVRRNAQTTRGIDSVIQPPSVLVGSHDPLLDWSLRESGSGIATFFDGSLDGLSRLAEGKAVACGMHVYEPVRDDWNKEHVGQALQGMPIVLIEWAVRQQGIIVAPGNPKDITSVRDLKRGTFVSRQTQAGSYILLNHLMSCENDDPMNLDMLGTAARSEHDVALAVADGKADAGFGIEAVARQNRLEFIPIVKERYDLAIWRRDYFEAPLQAVFEFVKSSPFAARAKELGGYDISDCGRVRMNGA